tara:strand:+ start:1170 stop:1415 length:246 start_codon:yes stop_codon:yes gene_type:complete
MASFTDYPIVSTGIVNGNTGSAGGDYIVTVGTGISAATLTGELGNDIYVFTGPEARGIYIPAGPYTIDVTGTGTVRVERAY